YKDGMFILGDEEKDDEVFALRPMTCPFQFTIYNTELHSYRDLPVRYNETSTLFRNESSGEMHGLTRVRQFTISEAHLICTPDQLANEFKDVVDLVHYVTSTLGLTDDLTYRFSRHDPANKEKFIDDEELWMTTEAILKDILDSLHIKYTEAIGEAAFYGPKLDVQVKNVHGKEDTLITIQIDRYLAERLDMTYIDADGSKKRPYIIHRTSIGCYERTLATLIEKYAGAMPMWLAPEQARILPISEKHHEVCGAIKATLAGAGMRVTLDDRSEKVGYKIREAQLDKIPYMLVVGDKEVEEGTVSVRKRGEGDLGSMTIDDFVALSLREIAERVIF
ncbi:MAG: threonine--tRNA ligase, partial [Clostridiales bacterium]|nr:threonine--tRNA ligase [Clostridiales bacterium]